MKGIKLIKVSDVFVNPKFVEGIYTSDYGKTHIAVTGSDKVYESDLSLEEVYQLLNGTKLSKKRDQKVKAESKSVVKRKKIQTKGKRGRPAKA